MHALLAGFLTTQNRLKNINVKEETPKVNFRALIILC
jgi:hypothetical protein